MLASIMPVSALLLIIASGLILSVWNLLVKKASDPSVFFLGAVVFGLALYTPAFVLIIAPGLEPPSFQAAAATALAGLTEGVYFILLTLTYRRGDLSLVYPVSRGSSPLFILAGGVLLLAEGVTVLGYVGIGLIVAGIAAVAWPGRGARVTAVAVILSLSTGASIAAHHVCYKWALGFVPSYAVIYVAWSIAAVALGVYCLATRPFFAAARYLYNHIFAAVAVGVIAIGGFLCALVALNMTFVSYMGAARNVGMIFSVIFGAQLLGEGARWRRLAGAGAITVGVAFIALA
ncbi:MAG: EamA family transporter [candidate division Zixibacteria bacterium]|nr:EamA family transporter [candidate division Zixibacteria bacterium]